jgi:4-diphosphocytidyl-2-C-methyl-D-erythritol kinase
MGADPPVVEFARAKVNLHLHITGRRADGYHLLDSFAVFPDIGDRLEAASADQLSLVIAGPFGECLSAGPDNLVLRAAEALGPGRGAALRLVKNLPVASGIGGGSADAAAALRALNQLWRCGLEERALERIGADLGADVPVCVRSRPTLMRGVGDELDEGPEVGQLALVLVNPRVAASTPEVFRHRSGPFSEQAAPPPAERASLIEWLVRQRNDLELPAIALHPEIGDVLATLRPHVRLARMSGSGATCFGICATRAEADAVAEAIRAARPEWWVTAAEA